MTSRLIKGMFGTQRRRNETFLKLKCGKIHANRVRKDCGWYNKKGEKLGWGDLSPDDFLNIKRLLKPAELFIVLSRSDSQDAFVTEHSSIMGSLSEVTPDIEAPGVEYVAETCIYIITNDTIYMVDSYAPDLGVDVCVKYRKGSINVKKVPRQYVQRIIAEANAI